MVEFLIEDGKLDTEESAVFDQLLAGLEEKDGTGKPIGVLDQLKRSNSKGYEEVCYSIGETYLFYYDVGSNAKEYNKAHTWLKECTDPVAKIYCEISECLQNIQKYSTAGQTSKEYEEYSDFWNKIVELHDQVSKMDDDDLKLHVWTEINSMINESCPKLSGVASKSELNTLLSKISSETSGITNSFLKDRITELKASIDNTITKINTLEG